MERKHEKESDKNQQTTVEEEEFNEFSTNLTSVLLSC